MGSFSLRIGRKDGVEERVIVEHVAVGKNYYRLLDDILYAQTAITKADSDECLMMSVVDAEGYL